MNKQLKKNILRIAIFIGLKVVQIAVIIIALILAVLLVVGALLLLSTPIGFGLFLLSVVVGLCYWAMCEEVHKWVKFNWSISGMLADKMVKDESPEQ
jgi:hypothetical protein